MDFRNGKRNLSFLVPEDQVALEFASIVKFMQGDPDRHVFRRFQKLNLYNLLHLQRKVADCDDRVSIHEQNWDGAELAKTLSEMQPLLQSYNEAFLLQVELAKAKAAPAHLVTWLMNYAKKSLRPLSHELDPGMGWSDLLCLSDLERGSVYKFIERRGYLSKIFKQRSSLDTSGLYTYSERNILIVERTIVNALFCILIIAPVFILTILDSERSRIAVVLTCVLLVAPVVSVLANRTQNTGLGVMAGYTAILVVFLSGGTNVQPCKCP